MLLTLAPCDILLGMLRQILRRCALVCLLATPVVAALHACPAEARPKGERRLAQQPAAPPQAPAPAPSRADILRGAWGPYRANNDLLSYDLSVRVDPDKKFISGTNTIRFRMLKDDHRIQLDLFANLAVDRIVFRGRDLRYEREINTVYVDFPDTLRKNHVYAIDFHYSGDPTETGRFGGITFKKDAAGHTWINTACQHVGASVWWPNKDQYPDEVESMRLSVAIPSDLVDVSNGRFVRKTDLGDGYTRWDWQIHYPINNYSVSLNIGDYVHFADKVDGQTLDFYALSEDLDKAKRQFVQAKSMMQAFRKYFGEYPFKKDGYKLIEVPYSGMEHQSAVTYGNHFANGYLERDWTGVGISPRFDFIIVHESAHEWFGNAITAADVSDEWIHEAWATYAEGVYVEHMWGKADGLKYLNGYVSKVRNREPIVTSRGVNKVAPQDMYFKGALFINTLRSIVDNDARWWAILHDYYREFRYHDIMTEDVVRFFNRKTGKNLTPIFDQYLRHADLPALELRFDDGEGTVSCRWKADEPAFDMPIKVGRRTGWQTIHPTTAWQTMKLDMPKEEFDVATDLYFVNVTGRPARASSQTPRGGRP
jgi:aminopeptidase N